MKNHHNNVRCMNMYISGVYNMFPIHNIWPSIIGVCSIISRGGGGTQYNDPNRGMVMCLLQHEVWKLSVHAWKTSNTYNDMGCGSEKGPPSIYSRMEHQS